MTKLASRLRFQVERLLIRGPGYQLFLIILVISVLSFGCGLLYFAYSAEPVEFLDASWWAFLRLTDPGYLGDDQGILKRVISTFLTVAGYVVFLGALIAIMTQSLYQSLRRLESGLTPITSIGHIVILGYVEATPSIVRNIFAAGGRLKRFLRRAEVRSPMIAILNPEVSYGLADDLKAHLQTNRDLKKTIFRSGSPLRDDDLDRINVDRASVVIIPTDDAKAHDPVMADARTIKALHSIHSRSQLLKKTEPYAVAEVYDRRMEQVAKTIYGERLSVVASQRFVAQIMAHCMVQPGFAKVLQMLLSVGEFPGFLVRDFPSLENKQWAEVKRHLHHVMPVGYIDKKSKRARLNPADDALIGEGDLIVVVGNSIESFEEDVARWQALNAGSLPVQSLPQSPAQPQKVLLLGWSLKVVDFIEALISEAYPVSEVAILSLAPTSEREKVLSRRKGNITIRQIEGDYSVAAVIEPILAEQFSAIVFVASERLNEVTDRDARTILGFFQLTRLLAKSASAKARLVVELVDPENEAVLRYKRAEVIITPVIVSHAVANIALRPELALVLRALVSNRHYQLTFLGRKNFDFPNQVEFGQLRFLDTDLRFVPLGLRTKNGAVLLNPQFNHPIDFAGGDCVIAIQTMPDFS